MSTLTSHEFDTTEAASKYMFGGNAVVTVQSTVTQKHYTYKISKSKDNADDTRSPLYFVKVRAGEDYRYIGYIKNNELRHGKKGCPNSDSYKAFQWLLKQLSTRTDIHPQMILQHEGTCGRCGRALTNPESLETGLGPICAGRE